jgi:serine/threonine protein kinase
VLHRDLKPANIMLTGAGRAKLMDFGIAGMSVGVGAGRAMEGTPAYMAPEQLAGGAATTRSDIYALGLVMHEIVTGQRLLTGRTVQEIVDQQSASGRIPQAANTASPRLREAILRCLNSDPSQRPESVQAVAATLQTVLLDARATWRRALQVMTQGLAIPFVLVGVNLLARSSSTGAIVGLVLLIVTGALVVLELRNPVGWAVTYKGHRIRFQNHPIFGERLYVDDALVDRGRFGLNVTLRGTIESGAGAGERITAFVSSSYASMACRIVVESFVPEQ